MLPLFSPAMSVVVYIFGNTCWAANASDSNSPPLTRSRTFSSNCSRDLSRCRLIKRSSAVRIGNPALISVRNCWLKIKNVDCRNLPRCPNCPPPRLRMVRGLTQYTRYPCCVNRSWISASEYPCSTCCRRWPCSSATLTRNCAIRCRLIKMFPVLNCRCRVSQPKSNTLFPKRLPQPVYPCGTQVTRRRDAAYRVSSCRRLSRGDPRLFRKLRSQFSFHRLHPRWRRELKPAVAQLQILFPSRKAELRRRPVRLHQYDADNLVSGCNLQLHLAHLPCRDFRNSSQQSVTRAQRGLVHSF